MKVFKVLVLVLLVAALVGCAKKPEEPDTDSVKIALSDAGILVDGAPIGSAGAVYAAKDIVYYEAGKDFTYGEGSEEDAHTLEEAAAHTVVHITQPGTYSLSGKLSKGQIAVDLGEDAVEDPKAVVTLVLNGVDISCDVAPAVIFYSVYECGDKETATKDVDTSAAGANVIIADGSENTISGAYVARIYKPDSVELNEAGTEVADAKKLHKYDGAFYSKMSMNIGGGKEGSGILNINAKNEGLDSELHLTVNGGVVNIRSGNDGINTNEDGVSVTTINGGKVDIKVTGETGEGDGIDSNGWLVVNGGTVVAAACSDSADAGIDSDMGIHINGGTVIAAGSMLNRIEDGGQTYAVFSFAQKQKGDETVCLKDADGKVLLKHTPENAYAILIFSSPDLKEGSYTLWSNAQQLAGQNGAVGRPGMPDMEQMLPEGEGDRQQPEGMTPPEGSFQPEGMAPPEGDFSPEGQPPQRPERPQGGFAPDGNEGGAAELTPEFRIFQGGNQFDGISPLS